jgi:transcriptional regulator with GAF, ATPase, and Fis domain
VPRRVDLIDQFAELVVGADDPRRLGRSGAVFACDPDPVLFASRGIDQSVLDTIPVVWKGQEAAFRRGETFYVADRATERRLPQSDRQGSASFAVAPVIDEDALIALLYVDSNEPHFCDTHDLERLNKFSRIVAKAVTETAPRRGAGPDAWETYLERTPVEDMEREKLLLLLNRNEWNIARVARLMGVTRRTVYLRLQRYNIPRERVPKGRMRSAS